MNLVKNFLFGTMALLITIFSFACQEEEPLSIELEPDVPTAIVASSSSSNSICAAATILCSPPLQVDTACIQMEMLIDGIPYNPVANFSCILPSIAVGADQLWINGSIIPANKVVTLRMPLDIAPGDYPILYNTLYDALYVPAIGADNFLGTSGNLFIEKHDTVCNYIIGGFDFYAENLQSPVQPSKTFEAGRFWAHY